MHVPDEANAGPVQAVAIIGAALRFPGASDPASFHKLTATGRRMFRKTAQPTGPSGQAGRDDLTASNRSPRAALLDDDPAAVGRDDALTGGITTRHILAEETAAAALADVPPAGRVISPERIGVFIADLPEPGTADVRDWVHRQLRMLTASDPVATPAHRRDLVAGTTPLQSAEADLRDLLLGTIGGVRPKRGSAAHNGASRGGAVNGTALVNGSMPGGLHCSLRAVAEACKALNSGEFDLVLAGGVAKGVSNWTHGNAVTALADEQVRVYDLSPTGALPGEGCGIVVLARAADSRAAQVPAYAEIAGWNYADQGAPQGAMLPEAYLRAGIDPADIQFVEGHGAANAADEVTEITALLEVLGRADNAVSRCALGSVSANIGDTRAAAGVAALLKTAFAMTAEIIPPSTGCVRPHRLLIGDATPFRLLSAPEPWPQTPVQLAAVNTLGTAPHPDAPRSGPVHLVLRRERDLSCRPGRHRKQSPLLKPGQNFETQPSSPKQKT